MDKEKEREIIDRLNKDSGYTERFKCEIYSLLPQLQFNYSLDTIFENCSILLAVDKVRAQFCQIPSVACTWHDVGPKPFDGDFMAACLNDYNDMFVVFLHPSNEMQNVGVHITVFECEVCFEIGTVSLDEDNYLSEDEAIFQLNDIINSWQEKGEQT